MTASATEKPTGKPSASSACQTLAAPQTAPAGLPRIVADIGSREGWDGLLAAFRARVAELGTTYESVDHVAGLPTRYASKLLAPVPIKGIGRQSLGPLLGALGLRLLIVVDEAAIERLASRLTPAKGRRGHTNVRTAGKQHLQGAGTSEWGRMMRSRGLLLTTPQQRRKWARNAIRARWSKKRKPSMLT